MSRPFDPHNEIEDAKRFKTLAAIFQNPQTHGLMERFAILAALAEEKAKILSELDEDIVMNDNEPVLKNHQGELADWSSITHLPKRRAGDN